MMRRFNFCEKWIAWVMGCLDSSFVSVLVNGSPTNEFKMEKGVRQGDPLAPFLFLMVAEGLNGIMRQAVATGNFIPLKIGRTVPVEIALLQFADDALFFGEAQVQNVLALKCVLRCYELVSGMKVNFHKSKLTGVSVSDDIIARFAALLHCRVMEIPFVYLGLPVGGNPRRVCTWDPVVAKLTRRLSVWKGKHLSFGGRLCLVKSVLSALPLYFISCYRMPKGVVKKCNQIMMRFLWGGTEEDRKIAWVRWAQICRPKAEGGLGVKDLESFNLALLGKWRWRLLQNQEQLWCRVLLAKYGNGLRSKKSVWWRDLELTCGTSAVGRWFDNSLCKRLGDGKDTLFWQESWHGHNSFQDKFGALFQISEQQNASIAEMGGWEENRWVWRLQWHGRIEGELADQLVMLTRILDCTSLIRDKKDAWFWIKESDGQYSVSSAYEVLFEPNGELEEFCFKTLWKILAPSNALAVGWKVLINRIQTRDNLLRRQIQVIDSRCPLCNDLNESVTHLFFSCSLTWQVWSRIFNWMGVYAVFSAEPKDHFHQFCGLFPFVKKNGLMSIWISVIWHIWMGRNAAVFREGSFTPDDVFELSRMKSWEWLRAKCSNFLHGTFEWHNEPICCLTDM